MTHGVSWCITYFLPHLQCTVEVLRKQAKEMSMAHQDQVLKLRKEIAQQMDDIWNKRLKWESHLCTWLVTYFPLPYPSFRKELQALKEELSSKYSEESRTAIARLGDIKDKGFENARKKWEAEKEKLMKQVSSVSCQMMHRRRPRGPWLDPVLMTVQLPVPCSVVPPCSVWPLGQQVGKRPATVTALQLQKDGRS